MNTILKNCFIKEEPNGSFELAFLKPTLRCFFEICDEYVNKYILNTETYFDVPWFYNERPTVGLFAGAIWRANRKNLVLEEYISEKTKNNNLIKGRRDIWFLIYDDENNNEEHSCYAEAKWDSIKLPNPKSFSSIKNCFERLSLDMQEIQQKKFNNKQKGFCMLFLYPRIEQSKTNTTKERIELYYNYRSSLEKEIKNKGKNGISLLWGNFNWLEMIDKNLFYKKTDRFYPGIDCIILLQPSDVDKTKAPGH